MKLFSGTKLPFVYIFFFFLSFVLVQSCKKEASKIAFSNTEKNDAIERAKTWVLKTSDQYYIRITKSGKQDVSNLLKWEEAHFFSDADYEVITVPLQDYNRAGLSIKDTKSESKRSVMVDYISFVIINNKRDNSYTRLLQNVITDDRLDLQKVNFRNIPNDFSGQIFLADGDNNFLNGKEYKNGKQTAIFNVKMASANGVTRMADECVSYIVDTWERVCFGDIYCTEWTLVNSQEVTRCPSTGGSGNNEEDMEQLIIAEFKSNYEMTSSADEITSTVIEGGGPNDIARKLRYTWVPARAKLINLTSVEIGDQIKVSGQVAQWNWMDLNHQKVQISGKVIGGVIEVLNEESYKNVGIYNSSMTLYITLKYSVLYRNSPISWTKAINSTAYISVND